MKKTRIFVGLWMGLACVQVHAGDLWSDAWDAADASRPVVLAQAANVWWDVCDGNWFTPGNWVPPHVPIATDTVYIDNGCGGPLIQQGNAVGGIVYVGSDTTGNTLEQRGLWPPIKLAVTELYLGESEGSSGTYKLSGVGQLTVQRTEYIGRNGNGAFTQSGGRNQVPTIYLGYNPTSAGTYELSGGDVAGSSLLFGYKGGSGVFRQTGGTASFYNCKVGNISISGRNCRYELSGTGIFTVSYDLFVTIDPTAETVEPNRFIQTGGNATVGHELKVGTGAWRPGSYEMSGGQLTVGNVSNYQRSIRVSGGCEGCPGGVARFVQSGGTVNIQTFGDYIGSLEIGLVGVHLGGIGRYELSETGQLTAETEQLGSGMSMGTFVHSGGRNTVTGTLSVGYGGNCAGDYLTSGRYELTGTAELQAGAEVVGREGGSCIDKFIQTGGTNTVQLLYLGYTPVGTGRYEISGGTLTALKLWVGFKGKGEFLQTNGTVTADNLEFGRESGSDGRAELNGTGVMAIGAVSVGRTGTGTLMLNGGTLVVDTLVVGRYSGTGGLEILDPSAQITIGKELTLGAKALFSAEPGSAIHMTHDPGGTVAAKFDNFRKVSSNVPGLANLELSFEGGANLTATAELAGRDLGAVEAGFVNNFVLGTLRVGTPGNSAYVRLVEANDNGNRGGPGGATEALYVHLIALSEGSTLDLNGLHVYYHYLCNEGGTIELHGGLLEQVAAAAPGDFDYDGGINLDDFAAFADCLAAPGATPHPQWVECAQACLNAFDFDDDGDVDFRDFSAFELNFTGSP